MRHELTFGQEQSVWSGEPSREPLKSLRPLRNQLKAVSIILGQQSAIVGDLAYEFRKNRWWDWNWGHEGEQNPEADDPPKPYYEWTRYLMNDQYWQTQDQKGIIEQLDALATNLRLEVRQLGERSLG